MSRTAKQSKKRTKQPTKYVSRRRSRHSCRAKLLKPLVPGLLVPGSSRVLPHVRNSLVLFIVLQSIRMSEPKPVVAWIHSRHKTPHPQHVYLWRCESGQTSGSCTDPDQPKCRRLCCGQPGGGRGRPDQSAGTIAIFALYPACNSIR